MAGLVELDDAPVLATDRRRAEPTGSFAFSAAPHELGDVLLLTIDADRPAHPLAQRQQVSALARANDREVLRQSDLGHHERRLAGRAERDLARSFADDIAHH